MDESTSIVIVGMRVAPPSSPACSVMPPVSATRSFLPSSRVSIAKARSRKSMLATRTFCAGASIHASWMAPLSPSALADMRRRGRSMTPSSASKRMAAARAARIAHSSRCAPSGCRKCGRLITLSLAAFTAIKASLQLGHSQQHLPPR